ncbi:hypothetical protein NPIL_498441 [Nephila pilipes]|uniref:Uncharacterized protein n=1 Tax=Nephila pilipes TaxID=299642 RepID=A0A8X6IGC0_NEPPI|nr:hypothetical protein NPIL_498441 [Nephila pilipes]
MFLSVAPRVQVFARSIRLPNEIGHRLAKGGGGGRGISHPSRIISFGKLGKGCMPSPCRNCQGSKRTPTHNYRGADNEELYYDMW